MADVSWINGPRALLVAIALLVTSVVVVVCVTGLVGLSKDDSWDHGDVVVQELPSETGRYDAVMFGRGPVGDTGRSFVVALCNRGESIPKGAEGHICDPVFECPEGYSPTLDWDGDRVLRIWATPLPGYEISLIKNRYHDVDIMLERVTY